jgi:caffeoyl-CoA O-methyltransferase
VIVSDAVERYLDSLHGPPDPLLAEMEAQAARERIPIVIPQTGRLLAFLAAASHARLVVEVGTAIGVSTLWMARALPPDGCIVSFEVDPGRHADARAYLERARVAARVDLRLEDARAGLRSLEAGSADVLFVDALKEQYRDYLDVGLRLLRPGGLVAADNALLDGTVATGRPERHWTEGYIERMRAVNAWLLARPDLEGTLLPVGDGVLVALRR